jgi:phage terminase large subunit-like protein
MADIRSQDTDEIPVSSIRKHLKKLHTTTAYLQLYCRWNYYRPHPETQLPFHNSHAKERSIVLGSQQGKTHAAGFEMAFAAVDLWPDWHKGRHPAPPKIERSAKFIGWFASVTSQNVRDGAQEKLLGNISMKDGMGQGALPLDYIEGITMSRGISNFVDTITIRRETGGTAVLQAKTYEQSVLSYQGTPVDMSWVDEDPGYDDRIYNELLARRISTDGSIIASLTPMLGTTPIRKRFIDGGPDIFQVRGGLEQALHITPERYEAIINSFPERERAARVYGLEMQGEGAVFLTPVSQIKHSRAHNDFDPDWPVVWGCDFSHHGQAASSHGAAFSFAFYDRVNDVIYVTDAIKMFQELPHQHVQRIKSHPCWDAPVCWPHDGARGEATGDTLADVYKKLGLRMNPSWTTLPNGGYDFLAGVLDMQTRFATGRLLIHNSCHEAFVEYQNYHFEKNLVKKVDDDILSSIRQICMGIRYARTPGDLERRRLDQLSGKQRMATGRDAWAEGSGLVGAPDPIDDIISRNGGRLF